MKSSAEDEPTAGRCTPSDHLEPELESVTDSVGETFRPPMFGSRVIGVSSSEDFYVIRNGRLSQPDDPLQPGAIYHLEPRLCGGKGGFGSMLRALGAQIEKTTNREACRDLSGRRLRDVNHEKE
ncbi:replication stress response regulator SDE2 [Plectropomus leopardus]|uniref:replication stress response regulator SDE2 n=1 Tax=Plectropomus leopardus TaxID=160734 RepID=UPI001C4A9DC7|nr:replication stress response regulator SDE2 [Plectropomus leopardus]